MTAYLLALPSMKVPAWPPKAGEDPPKALRLPVGEALARRYATDSVLTGYDCPEYPYRLRGESIPAAQPVMTVFFADDDDPAAHAEGGGASRLWRAAENEKIEAIRKAFPGLVAYHTQGGCRLVGLLPAPFLIDSPAAGEAWKVRYGRTLLYLARTYDFTADPACMDWPHLYRPAHGTRAGQPPENWPTIGNLTAVGTFDWVPDDNDLDADIVTAEKLSKGEGVSRDRWTALARLLRPKAPPPSRPALSPSAARIERYGAAALDSAAEKIAGTPPGGRNGVLNSEAFAVGGLVASGYVPEAVAASVLAAAGVAAGLSEGEARASARSGLEAGQRHPRALPEPSFRTVGALALAPAAAEEGWADRKELPAPCPAAPTLTPDFLPAPLRPWLADVADRVSIPLEFVAAPAIVALGAIVGRSVFVRPMARDDWRIPMNLWGGIVGPPGVMKTAAIAEALRPTLRLAANARREFEEAAAEREIAGEALEARVKARRGEMEKAAKKNDSAALAVARDEMKAIRAEEADATERRYTTSDATIEKLGVLLNETPRGLLVVRDELTGWLRGLDREDRAQDRAFYLESWNGDGSFTVDRMVRGTLYVPALCLSVLGGIQPGRYSSYVSGAIEGEDDADGLIQRFQMTVWPDSFGEWRGIDRWPDKTARERVFGIFSALDAMDPATFGAEPDDDGPFFRFSPDAQGLFLDWRHELERRLRSEEMQSTPAYCSHLAKYRSLLPKLATLFHLVDLADGAPAGPVSLSAARLAAAWTEFLEAHARKVYVDELAGPLTAARSLADKMKAGAIYDGMTVRAIAERGWSGLGNSGKVFAGAEVLASAGWLRLEEAPPGPTGGRPSPFLRLHPDLRGRL